jgi:hypothetical protein
MTNLLENGTIDDTDTNCKDFLYKLYNFCGHLNSFWDNPNLRQSPEKKRDDGPVDKAQNR